VTVCTGDIIIIIPWERRRGVSSRRDIIIIIIIINSAIGRKSTDINNIRHATHYNIIRPMRLQRIYYNKRIDVIYCARRPFIYIFFPLIPPTFRILKTILTGLEGNVIQTILHWRKRTFVPKRMRTRPVAITLKGRSTSAAAAAVYDHPRRLRWCSLKII